MLLKVPPVAPTNLRLLKKGLDSITVVWRPIIGQVSGYTIKYKEAGNGIYAYVNIDVSLGKSQWQGKITDLKENTAYEIQVAGYSEDGTGPYSEQIIETTKSGKFILNLCILQYAP